MKGEQPHPVTTAHTTTAATPSRSERRGNLLCPPPLSDDCRVYVTNIPADCTFQQFYSVVKAMGQIRYVQDYGRCINFKPKKGFAFVEYASNTAVAAAVGHKGSFTVTTPDYGMVTLRVEEAKSPRVPTKSCRTSRTSADGCTTTTTNNTTNTTTTTTTTKTSGRKQPKRRPRSHLSPAEEDEEARVQAFLSQWKCTHCTFRNGNDRVACDICNVSECYFECTSSGGWRGPLVVCTALVWC